MSCYNNIYMCKNCIDKLKLKEPLIENDNYCIGECVIIGKYVENIHMCKNCILSTLTIVINVIIMVDVNLLFNLVFDT